jgi:hypothetical protein
VTDINDKVDKHETLLRLKHGEKFRQEIFKKAYEADAQLNDVEINIALRQLKINAGVK